MKVLVMTSLFPNDIQPDRAVFIKQFCQKLSENAEVLVVAPVPYFPPIVGFKRWSHYSRIPREERLESMRVYHPRYLVIPKLELFTGIFYFITALRWLRRVRKQFNYDVLNVHWAYPDGFAGALLQTVFKTPVIMTVHGSDIYIYSNYPGVRRLLKWAINRVASVVAVSHALRSAIEAMGVRRNIHVIPCAAVDPKLFRILDQEDCRKGLKLPGKKRIILFVGNLVAVKGVRYLLDAMKILMAARKEDVLLILVGDGSERTQLQRQARRMGLESCVLFVGKRPHEEIPLWMNSADVFCLPSLSEGMPNVVVEALACGKPVVGTQVGGVPEIVRSDRLGYMVPPEDGAALSKAIGAALSNHWDTADISQYGNMMTWDINVQAYLGIIRSLLPQST